MGHLQNRQSNLQVTYAQLLVEYLVVHTWMDTLNFNMYTSDEYGLSSSTVEYYHHKRKRHACIIESDSEDDEVLLVLLHLAHIYYAVPPL